MLPKHPAWCFIRPQPEPHIWFQPHSAWLPWEVSNSKRYTWVGTEPNTHCENIKLSGLGFSLRLQTWQLSTLPFSQQRASQHSQQSCMPKLSTSREAHTADSSHLNTGTHWIQVSQAVSWLKSAESLCEWVGLLYIKCSRVYIPGAHVNIFMKIRQIRGFDLSSL